MTKLRLAIFAILAVSLIMGTSAVMVDAAKPEVVSQVTHEELCGGICSTNPSVEPLCGEIGAVVKFEISITETAYGKDKFKTVRDVEGTAYDSAGEEIGTVKDLETVNGHYEGNGAEVIRSHVKINCMNGSSDEFTHEVLVSNHGNKN
jgi:hypothetical protein